MFTNLKKNVGHVHVQRTGKINIQACKSVFFIYLSFQRDYSCLVLISNSYKKEEISC